MDAGLAAGEVYALAEADEHLRWAVDVMPQLTDDAAVSGSQAVDLLAAAAEAAHLNGDGQRAAALVTDAISRVEDPGRRAALY